MYIFLFKSYLTNKFEKKKINETPVVRIINEIKLKVQNKLHKNYCQKKFQSKTGKNCIDFFSLVAIFELIVLLIHFAAFMRHLWAMYG